MKPLIFALCVVSVFANLRAQKPAWQPSPGHTQVPIWPGAAPDAEPVTGPENTGPGGHLVAAISTHFEHRLYPAVDAADKQSCRPDFAVAIYPGHLSLSAAEWDARQGTRKFVVNHSGAADKHLGLNPAVPV